VGEGGPFHLGVGTTSHKVVRPPLDFVFLFVFSYNFVINMFLFLFFYLINIYFIFLRKMGILETFLVKMVT
jgi:hypothetical protein